MQVTISIGEAPLDSGRERAASLGWTSSAVAEDSVCESLLHHQAARCEPFRVHPFDGGRPQPCLGLDDNVALRARMEC